MRVIGKILLWLLEAPVLFMARGSAMNGVAACAAFVLLALLILPVDALQKRLRRALPGKRRVIAAVVLFCTGFVLLAGGLAAADSIQSAPTATASAEPSFSPMAAEQTVQSSPRPTETAAYHQVDCRAHNEGNHSPYGEACRHVQSNRKGNLHAYSQTDRQSNGETDRGADNKGTAVSTVKPTITSMPKPTAAPTAVPTAMPIPAPTATYTYVLNTSRHVVFHKTSCYHISAMN